jgi:hypothetical protein
LKAVVLPTPWEPIITWYENGSESNISVALNESSGKKAPGRARRGKWVGANENPVQFEAERKNE